MTQPRRPRRASAARRADVLAAARHLFAERGFSAISTRELAAAADLNDALLYRYFPNKKAILTALVDQAISECERLPALDRRAAQLPLEELLTLIGTAFVRTATEHLDLLTIVLTEHQTMADDRRFAVFIDAAAARLGGLLDHRVSNARPGSGYLTARAFMGALVAFVLLQDVLGLSAVRVVDSDAFVANLAAVTAAGVGTSSPPASPSLGRRKEVLTSGVPTTRD